jgi:ankyrin repeat protein
MKRIQRLYNLNGRKVINEPDPEGRTPLLIAVEKGYMDVVTNLIELGAIVDATPDDAGNTPLRQAASTGSLDMVKLLIAAGANPLLPGRFGLTPLDRARERRTPEGRMIASFLERHLASQRITPRRRK